VGKGADEAGIGDLDVRRVIAVNPDEWGAGEDGRGLLGFFERYYPGVDARQATAPDIAALRQLLETTLFENLPALRPFQPPDTEEPPPGEGTEPVEVRVNERVGINLNLEPASPHHHPHRAPTVEELKSVGWVRLVFKDHDRLDLTRDQAFDHYGRIIDRYREAGIKTLLILNWESFGGAGRWISDDLTEITAGFAEYVREVAQHFNGRVAAYQIWNEGDAPAGNQTSVHLEPEQYGPVLLRAGRTIKAVDRDALVVFGGLMQGAQNVVNYVQRTREHMQGEWPVDAVAVHPYGQHPIDDIPGLPLANHGKLRNYLTQVTGGLPGIPIWITEIGVPLGGVVQPQADDSSFHWDKIAAYLRAVYAEVEQDFGAQVPVVLWFAWSNKMEGAGIVDTQDKPRGEIYEAFFQVVRGSA